MENYISFPTHIICYSRARTVDRIRVGASCTQIKPNRILFHICEQPIVIPWSRWSEIDAVIRADYIIPNTSFGEIERPRTTDARSGSGLATYMMSCLGSPVSAPHWSPSLRSLTVPSLHLHSSHSLLSSAPSPLLSHGLSWVMVLKQTRSFYLFVTIKSNVNLHIHHKTLE